MLPKEKIMMLSAATIRLYEVSQLIAKTTEIEHDEPAKDFPYLHIWVDNPNSLDNIDALIERVNMKDDLYHKGFV